MEKALKLVPFTRVLCEFHMVSGLTFSVEDCSYLARRYAKAGVTGYRLDGYTGTGYLTRYLEHSIHQIPMLLYKNRYRIPLIFRDNTVSHMLARETYRWPAFFKLLDWYLKYRPEQVMVHGDKKQKIVDTAFLTFRLSEICDGAAFPFAHFEHLAEFEEWNQIYRLIEEQRPSKSEQPFDRNDPIQLSELKTIIEIIRMKYLAGLSYEERLQFEAEG